MDRELWMDKVVIKRGSDQLQTYQSVFWLLPCGRRRSSIISCVDHSSYSSFLQLGQGIMDGQGTMDELGNTWEFGLNIKLIIGFTY